MKNRCVSGRKKIASGKVVNRSKLGLAQRLVAVNVKCPVVFQQQCSLVQVLLISIPHFFTGLRVIAEGSAHLVKNKPTAENRPSKLVSPDVDIIL